jgi:hypothetical protein
MLHLLPGTHHLKFIVDGEMRTSNDLPTAVDLANVLVNYIEVSPEGDQRRLEDIVRAGDPVTGTIEVAAVRNRGMKLNEAKKLKREILTRDQAAQAAQEAELAARRLGELGSSFRNLFSPLSSALANLQRHAGSSPPPRSPSPPSLPPSAAPPCLEQEQ